MNTVPLTPATIADLRANISGRVITPEDPDYDKARAVFYGGYDRKPALVVYVANDSDVSRVVTLARETGIELAVRSGGHSGIAQSTIDYAIVLDISKMQALTIDPEQRTAWAEMGMTAGQYTKAAGAYGLATGFGDTGSVGLGGLTLGGGFGYLVREYGLTIDNMLAANVVTADGQLLRADADTNPDLFWAIRGGGGNFGVVTRVQYRLHEVGMIVGGMLMLPVTSAVIAGFAAAAEAAPEKLSIIANLMHTPPMPGVPEEQVGKLCIMLMTVYDGDAEEGEKAVAPFRALATPIVDTIKAQPYPDMYPPEEEEYHPIVADHTMFINKVDHEVADMIIDYLTSGTQDEPVTQLRVLGGAFARVPVDATAFAHRKSRIMVNIASVYKIVEERAARRSWVTQYAADMNQGDNGAYVNFIGEEGAEWAHSAYPEATWNRLAQIKQKYDPTNLFRHNRNVPPAGTN